MATRKPAKTLSPSGRRRRSKRTIDTSQLCPRSTWLTHVRSGFEQRAGERPYRRLNLVLCAVEVLLTAPRVVEVVSGRGGRPRWALPSASTSSRAAQTRRRSAIGERHTKMKKFGFAMRNLDKR